MVRLCSLVVALLLLPGWTRYTVAQSASVSSEPAAMTAYQAASLRIEVVKTAGTIAAILVPLIVGVLAQVSQRKREFQTKTIEWIMDSPTPWIAKDRAAFMAKLFPGSLSQINEKLKVEDFPGIRLYEMKMELIKLLAANPDHRAEIEAEWKKQFPDSWKFGIK
jgi:hypothetical protein